MPPYRAPPRPRNRARTGAPLAKSKRRFGTVYEDRRADRSSRGFAARWTDEAGRRHHRRGFSSRGQAEDFVLERFAEVRAARARLRGEVPDARLPFRDLLPRILDAWKGRVRKVTHRNHQIHLRQWAAVLGKRPVREITTAVVQECIDVMLSTPEDGGPPAAPGVPRGLNPSSVRTLRWTLSGAFTVLRATLGIDVPNPCTRGQGLALPRPQQGGGRVFTAEELRRFLEQEAAVAEAFAGGRYGSGRVAAAGRLSARGRHVIVAAAARRRVLSVLANTGLRPEELRRLRWSWIRGDWTALELRETKTHDTRVVPIDEGAPPAAVSLQALRAELEAAGFPPGPDDLVFPIGYSMVHTMVRQAGKAAGLGHVTPYVLRRTYGTNLIHDGVSIEDVATLMGHSSIQTTHKYVRGAGKGAVDRVRKAIGGRAVGVAAEAAGAAGAAEAPGKEEAPLHEVLLDERGAPGSGDDPPSS